jgi:very-short-patch-repair endonuclease
MKKVDGLRSRHSRQTFFATTVHHPKVKNCISGRNETSVMGILKDIGFIIDVDFVRQHPVGEKFVLDFAFIPEQIALEIDGESHESKLQKLKDKRRDSYLRNINWIPIRIKDKELFGYKGSFYKSLVKEIVDERRKQWEIGELFSIDFPNYIDEDYE